LNGLLKFFINPHKTLLLLFSFGGHLVLLLAGFYINFHLKKSLMEVGEALDIKKRMAASAAIYHVNTSRFLLLPLKYGKYNISRYPIALRAMLSTIGNRREQHIQPIGTKG
jgi:hypothetical protein